MPVAVQRQHRRFVRMFFAESRPGGQGVTRWPALNGTVASDPYGATIERTGDGTFSVEYNGLEAEDFVSRALANLENGYGCVPIGRVDPCRSDLPPHKVAWCCGYHGYNARNATPTEINAMPRKIIGRLAEPPQ